MRWIVTFALIVATTAIPTIAGADDTSSVCRGRVAVIETVQHPTDSDAVGTMEQRSAWAIRTQDQVTACVADGTISPAYGYFLRLKVAARMVRYLKQTAFGDSTDVREAQAAFDDLYIAARPTFVGTTFANLADELRSTVDAPQ